MVYVITRTIRAQPIERPDTQQFFVGHDNLAMNLVDHTNLHIEGFQSSYGFLEFRYFACITIGLTALDIRIETQVGIHRYFNTTLHRPTHNVQSTAFMHPV